MSFFLQLQYEKWNLVTQRRHYTDDYCHMITGHVWKRSRPSYTAVSRMMKTVRTKTTCAVSVHAKVHVHVWMPAEDKRFSSNQLLSDSCTKIHNFQTLVISKKNPRNFHWRFILLWYKSCFLLTLINFQATQTDRTLSWEQCEGTFSLLLWILPLSVTYLVLMVGFILRGNSPKSMSSLSGLNSSAPET